jgi:hypothetical protein
VERLGQPVEELAGEGVPGGGPVEREGAHATSGFNQQDVGHGRKRTAAPFSGNSK